MIHNSKLGMLIALVMLAAMGCVDSTSTSAPPDFGKLFDGLVEVDADLQKALSTDPPAESAHDLLHDAGRIVSSLAEVDSQSGLTASQCTEVHNIAQDLMGAYGALDTDFESGEVPDYEAMREQTTAITGQLASVGTATIVPSDAVSQGGCRVLTEFGVVDQTIEAQLERIAEELS